VPMTRTAQRGRNALRAVAQALGVTVDQALKEKQEELVLREFWRARPIGDLDESEWRHFARAIGLSKRNERRAYSVVAKRRRFGEEVLRRLEAKQDFLCALCGCKLKRVARPQLDHIEPLALGGADSEENLQILCRNCNGGKGARYHWLMATPFFFDARSQPGRRLRYAVLSRFDGECQWSGCLRSRRDGEMAVCLRRGLPVEARAVFDNLSVYCAEHVVELDEEVDDRLNDLRSAVSERMEVAQVQFEELQEAFDEYMGSNQKRARTKSRRAR